MTNRRRTDGDETWSRLLNWTNGQKPSERLAGHILASDGFNSLDPSHPLGGQDGLKDIICKKNNIEWVAAAYFPNGEKSFSDIKSKFSDDVEGVKENKVSGFIFVVNQYLTISQRNELKDNQYADSVEIYHLEKISRILDEPKNYGIRLEYLDIQMTKEEQLAFFASLTDGFNNWKEQVKKIFQDLKNADVNIDSSIINDLEFIQHKLNQTSSMAPIVDLSTSLQNTSFELDILEGKLLNLQTNNLPNELSNSINNLKIQIDILEGQLNSLSINSLMDYENTIDRLINKLNTVINLKEQI